MTQTLVDITKVKDRDTASAVDATALILANAGIAANGAITSGVFNGTVGATTPSTVASTTVTASGNVSLTGTALLLETATVAITAGSTRTQAGATALTTEVNRVDTSTAPSAGTVLGDGVKLMAAAAGLDVCVINNTANAIQVYGAGTDTINGVTNTVGIAMPPNSLFTFESGATGTWQVTSGLGYSGALNTVLTATAITAAGTTQAGATPLPAEYNNLGTVGSGTGVNLPASATGLQITVINSGANPVLVYPAQGASDTINGIAATIGVALQVNAVGVFTCPVTGTWLMSISTSPAMDAFNTASNTTSFTATGANVTGGQASVAFAITGTLGSGQNVTTPTAANWILALHSPAVGTTYRLRIINESSGAFAWTVVANATGVTLTGTATIAQNTWREYLIRVASATTITMQNIGTGTFS